MTSQLRQRIFVLGLMLCFGSALGASSAAAMVSITVGDATGSPGSLVSLPVSLDTGDALVAGMQNDLQFDATAVSLDLVNGKPDCQANSVIDKSLVTTVLDSESMRALLFAFANIDPIPSGVLYTCRFRIGADAPTGDYPISISAITASDPSGHVVPNVMGQSGMITVVTPPPVVVDVASVTGMPGETVGVAVSLRTFGQAVAGVQNDVSIGPTALDIALQGSEPDCQVNPSINKQLSVALLDNGTRLRALVFSVSDLSPIPDGVLYSCQFFIHPDAAPGSYDLTNSGIVVSDPRGDPLDNIGSDGSITVSEPVCSDDCNGDGQITVDELVKAINVALGNLSIDACTAADADHDGTVSISEIIAGVLNAQSGCS